jgi:hypothetical protein
MSGRRITILGMGPTAAERRLDIERYVSGTEVWGLNNGYLSFPTLTAGRKFARYFELHGYKYLKGWNPGGPRCHFEVLNALGCPIYVTQPLPISANQRRVDYVQIFEHFQTNYFLGSPSLMLVLALWEHDQGDTIEMIQSYGIDTRDPQHAQQRASWAWWLAHAHTRHIDVQGTATEFFAEPEKDGGLHGYREWIGDQIAARQAQTKQAALKAEQTKGDEQ